MSRGPADSEFTTEVIEAGKRAADNLNIHILCNTREAIRDRWVAIRLMDGSSDGTLYDNSTDAIAHQRHEQECWYVCFRGLSPGGISVRDCSIMIMHYRKARDAGLRFVDPDSRFKLRQPVMSAQRYDFYDSLVNNKSIEMAMQKYGRNN